ncbi:MAG: hypothetical protein AB7G80_06465 [Dongiaceae bacterium]
MRDYNKFFYPAIAVGVVTFAATLIRGWPDASSANAELAHATAQQAEAISGIRIIENENAYQVRQGKGLVSNSTPNADTVYQLVLDAKNRGEKTVLLSKNETSSLDRAFTYNQIPGNPELRTQITAKIPAFDFGKSVYINVPGALATLTLTGFGIKTRVAGLSRRRHRAYALGPLVRARA